MDSTLGVKSCQNLCFNVVILKLTLMISLRGGILCLEYMMVRDGFLKVSGWLLNMDQEREVYLGNQYFGLCWY